MNSKLKHKYSFSVLNKTGKSSLSLVTSYWMMLSQHSLKWHNQFEVPMYAQIDKITQLVTMILVICYLSKKVHYDW